MKRPKFLSEMHPASKERQNWYQLSTELLSGNGTQISIRRPVDIYGKFEDIQITATKLGEYIKIASNSAERMDDHSAKKRNFYLSTKSSWWIYKDSGKRHIIGVLCDLGRIGIYWEPEDFVADPPQARMRDLMHEQLIEELQLAFERILQNVEVLP